KIDEQKALPDRPHGSPHLALLGPREMSGVSPQGPKADIGTVTNQGNAPVGGSPSRDAVVPHAALEDHLRFAESREWLSIYRLLGGSRALWRGRATPAGLSAPVKRCTSVNRTDRDRHFKDNEIKAIWTACDKLEAVEAGYLRLLVLLAPRKSALANMR